VYVLTPVTAVIEDLMSLISGLALQAGTRESLNSKLEAAKKAAASGDAETACALLSAFINFVVSSPWRAGDAAHSGGSGGSGCDRNNVIDFNRGRALPPRTMVDRSVASVSLNYVRSIRHTPAKPTLDAVETTITAAAPRAATGGSASGGPRGRAPRRRDTPGHGYAARGRSVHRRRGRARNAHRCLRCTR
jgi:hypothetical protein